MEFICLSNKGAMQVILVAKSSVREIQFDLPLSRVAVTYGICEWSNSHAELEEKRIQ